jgi:hypothetical protein
MPFPLHSYLLDFGEDLLADPFDHLVDAVLQALLVVGLELRDLSREIDSFVEPLLPDLLRTRLVGELHPEREPELVGRQVSNERAILADVDKQEPVGIELRGNRLLLIPDREDVDPLLSGRRDPLRPRVACERIQEFVGECDSEVIVGQRDLLHFALVPEHPVLHLVDDEIRLSQVDDDQDLRAGRWHCGRRPAEQACCRNRQE